MAYLCDWLRPTIKFSMMSRCYRIELLIIGLQQFVGKSSHVICANDELLSHEVGRFLVRGFVGGMDSETALPMLLHGRRRV